ncbi:MAG: hypothetical protein K6A90_13960 [Lachnospiraceae bacterium]|nr:hypothetical protein [Lachnospiraceae bacterium]
MNIILMFIAVLLLLSYSVLKGDDPYFTCSHLIIILALAVYSVTEILSVLYAVNLVSLSVFWVIICFIFVLLIYRSSRGPGRACRLLTGKIRSYLKMISDDPLKVIIVSIALVSFVIALVTVPYNFDSMVYHLARVAHWEQNHSIAHYATNVIRQISTPVFAEIVMLHIYILSGHVVNLCNLVQLFSFIGVAVSIKKVGDMLGISKKMILIAVIIFMTMPIAFAESVSTQNDLVTTLWFVLFVSEMVNLLEKKEKLGFDRDSLIRVSSMSGLLALLYLTKPSCLFGICVMLIISVPILISRREDIRVLLSYAFFALIIMAAFLAPEIIRNYETFGKAIDSSASGNIMIGSIAPGYLILNFFKNFTLNLPTRLSPYVAMGIEVFLKLLSNVLGISVNDPAINFEGEYSAADPLAFHHDFAINPLTEWIVILSFIVFIVLYRKISKKMNAVRWWVMVSGISSFMLFCVVLKYQAWGTRLMLPYLAFICIVIGLFLDLFSDLKIRNKMIMVAVCPVVLFLSLTTGINIIMFQTRCAVKVCDGGVRALYASYPTIYDEDYAIAERIKERGDFTVGMAGTNNSYEFPFFVMLDGAIGKYYHVDIGNQTDKYAVKEAPDCIIWKRGALPGDTIEINGAGYTEDYSTGETILLVKI